MDVTRTPRLPAYTQGMQINSPDRATIKSALKARSAEQIRQGDLQGAAQTQRDELTLSKASGETLYEKYRLASERKGPAGLDAMTSHYGGFTLFAGLAGVAGGLTTLFCAVPPVLPIGLGIGVGLLVASGVTFGTMAVIGARNRKQAGIRAAVERQQDAIRSYNPAHQEPGYQIDCKVFLAALQGQEARLAETGFMQRAVQMRQIHETLAKVQGDTVEDMFGSLIERKNKPVLDLIQGPCSGEIAEAIETLDQVGKLVAPGTLNTVREEADSLVVGGVVLKKKAAQASDSFHGPGVF